MTQEANLSCPNCSSSLRTVSDPDVSYEECPNCGGVFLDKGELDVLATGLAGEIEYSSIEQGVEYPDEFPTRICPKCPGREMKKEDLLIYSEIILDYCLNCGGWFLDRGELETMNAYLDKLRRSQGGRAEFRGKKGRQWVTVSELSDIELTSKGGTAMRGVPTAPSRRIHVHYRAPLGIGLRISPETWTKKLSKLFGLADIQTGDREFDKAFLIHGEDEDRVIAALTPEARTTLLAFQRSPSSRVGSRRSFEILDDRIVFTYAPTEHGHALENAEQKLIAELVELAGVIDTSPDA